jgi:small multidrug resistance family-3 protein
LAWYPGLFGLIAFAWLLTKIDTNGAGRAYAAYGGIYIVASFAWLWAIEGKMPDRWDVIGGAICVLGALVILYDPRTT